MAANIIPVPEWTAIPGWDQATPADGLEMNKQGQSLANRVELLKQRTDKAVLSFPDYAAASAAVAALPLAEGQPIEIEVDELHEGRSTRYVVQSGALVFVQYGVRDDLADPTKGANLVATSDGRTVETRLAAIPNEVDAAGTATVKVAEHNADAAAHPALSAFITSEANRAEAAKDAALIQAGVYVDEPTGRAAVADGQAFKVQGSGDVAAYEYRRIDSSTSTLLAIYPSIAATTKNFTEVDVRNGYVWGVLDSAQRLGLGLRIDGKLDVGVMLDMAGHITSLETLAPVLRSERSGYLWGVIDSNDRLALALDLDGTLISKGRNILAELDSNAGLAAVKKWITPLQNIATWGDSLSENTWQPYLRTLMPTRDIFAGGVGGQTSRQIARRQGGVAPMISISGNLIPAAGAVTCTVDYPFLYSAQILYGRLGGVFGTLSVVAGNTTFTRSVNGAAVAIDAQTPFIISNTDYDYDFRTTIIWAGNNNASDTAQVDADVQRMVDFLKPQEKRFAVISLIIGDYPERYAGGTYQTNVLALHALWRERWPNNFIDANALLIRNYDPGNAQDVIDVGRGVVPSSLRIDNIHLNEAGKQIIANRVYDFLTTRGW